MEPVTRSQFSTLFTGLVDFCSCLVRLGGTTDSSASRIELELFVLQKYFARLQLTLEGAGYYWSGLAEGRQGNLLPILTLELYSCGVLDSSCMLLHIVNFTVSSFWVLFSKE